MDYVEIQNMGKAEQYNKLQGAVQTNCSSLHDAWLIKKTFAFNVENKKNVYVWLLDTK